MLVNYTDDGDNDGFWFGTQSLRCLTSSANDNGGRQRNRMRRQTGSIDRPDWHYIHRLIYYKHHVIEWGAGARGYYIGPHAAVTECPTTWEVLPAGRSTCSVAQLRLFATSYKRQYGGYNLLANNCHHFANRAARLLVNNCTMATPVTDDVITHGPATPTVNAIRSDIMNWAWSMMSWVLTRTAAD